MPERFEEIDPDADMTCTMGDLDMMDVEGATVFVGTKGMASCGWGGSDPRFWPKGQKANKKPLFDKDVNIPHNTNVSKAARTVITGRGSTLVSQDTTRRT